MAGDAAYAERLKVNYTDKDGIFDEAKYTAAVRKGLRENDTRITEAAKAVNALKNFCGKTKEEAEERVQYWAFCKRYTEYELSEAAVCDSGQSVRLRGLVRGTGQVCRTV